MDSQRQRVTGTLWVLASAAGFGAMAVFAKLAYGEGINLPTLLFLRFLIAGGVMSALVTATATSWPRGRDLWLLAAMGGIGYFGQSFCYFAALQYASAGLTALLLYLYPALVTLLIALRTRRLSFDRLLAVAIALIGTSLAVGGALSGSAIGVALGIGAAVIYSVYIVAGEGVTRRAGSIPSSTVIMLAAAAVYGIVAASKGFALPQTATGWAATLAIALLSTALAIVGFFKGMARLGAADAATLSTFEPVVTIVLAALVLDESVTAVQIFGGALILATVIYLARRSPG